MVIGAVKLPTVAHDCFFGSAPRCNIGRAIRHSEEDDDLAAWLAPESATSSFIGSSQTGHKGVIGFMMALPTEAALLAYQTHDRAPGHVAVPAIVQFNIRQP
jgi:hypothetical protein